MDPLALSLLRRVLSPYVSKRFSIAQIKLHPWFTKNFKGGMPPSGDVSNVSGGFEDCSNSRKRSCIVFGANKGTKEIIEQFCFSQPEFLRQNNSAQNENKPNEPSKSGVVPYTCLSQPACLDDMLLNSQLTGAATTQANQNPIQRLVKRMTRFFVTCSCEQTASRLTELFTTLNYSFKPNDKDFTISTTDRRRQKLVFKAKLMEMNDNVLVDFRLSKGCGLEFKRHFLKIKQAVRDITAQGPVLWPLAMALNSAM